MDGLFDFLFNNPFLLLLIIGWFFTLFRGGPKKEQQEQQRKPLPRQQGQQNRPIQSREQRRPLHEEQRSQTREQRGQPLGKIEVEQRPVVQQASVQKQRLEQFEQLQDRLGAHLSTIDEIEIEDSPIVRTKRDFHQTKNETAKRLSKRFNQQGLIDSIIMAEVLGKPRAKRTHHRDFM